MTVVFFFCFFFFEKVLVHVELRVKKLISWALGFKLIYVAKKYEKREVKQLQGEVGLVKTALHTSPLSPIYLQIMFLG